MKSADDLLYNSNIKLILDILDKWSTAKPDNKELRALIEAFWEITTFVSKLRVSEQDAKLEASDNKRDHNVTKLHLKDIGKVIQKLIDEDYEKVT